MEQATRRLTPGWKGMSGHSSQRWPSRPPLPDLLVTVEGAPCRIPGASAQSLRHLASRGRDSWEGCVQRPAQMEIGMPVSFQSLPRWASASRPVQRGRSPSLCATSRGARGPADPLPASAAAAPRPCPRGPGGRRRVLTAQVVLPHPVRLPERSAVNASAAAAASSTAAGSRSPALLHHLPAPAARCLGRHDSGSATSRLSSSHGLRAVPRRRCRRRRKAAWDS